MLDWNGSGWVVPPLASSETGLHRRTDSGRLATIDADSTTNRIETRAYNPFGHLTELAVNDGTTDTEDLDLLWDPTQTPNQVIWSVDNLNSDTWTRSSYGIRRIGTHNIAGDTQLKVHLARLVELELVWAHRAERSGGFVYRLTGICAGVV